MTDLQELVECERPQLGELEDDLADEGEDVVGGQFVRVRQELDHDGNDGGGDVRELEAEAVEAADQELAVLVHVVGLVGVVCFGHLRKQTCGIERRVSFVIRFISVRPNFGLDFAGVFVEFMPDNNIVEHKKLYLVIFENFQFFHDS